jgi:hypothetical protein
MTGTAAQQAMCGSVRYREAETTVPACHLSRHFFWTASRNLYKTCTKKWPAAICPGDTKSLVQQTVDVKEYRELFDCPSYIYCLFCMGYWTRKFHAYYTWRESSYKIQIKRIIYGFFHSIFMTLEVPFQCPIFQIVSILMEPLVVPHKYFLL